MLKLAASQLSVHAVGNRSSEESGIGVPSYKDCYGTRSSEESGLQTPPTKIRESEPAYYFYNVFYTFFVNFALFLMGFAFFSQKTAIFCNFKLTMGV